jgi:hypothetical protein
MGLFGQNEAESLKLDLIVVNFVIDVFVISNMNGWPILNSS